MRLIIAQRWALRNETRRELFEITVQETDPGVGVIVYGGGTFLILPKDDPQYLEQQAEEIGRRG